MLWYFEEKAAIRINTVVFYRGRRAGDADEFTKQMIDLTVWHGNQFDRGGPCGVRGRSCPRTREADLHHVVGFEFEPLHAGSDALEVEAFTPRTSWCRLITLHTDVSYIKHPLPSHLPNEWTNLLLLFSATVASSSRRYTRHCVRCLQSSYSHQQAFDIDVYPEEFYQISFEYILLGTRTSKTSALIFTACLTAPSMYFGDSRLGFLSPLAQHE